jgi:Insertion element 4 transposase N-terminal
MWPCPTATGSATVRRRKLPAEYVAWIVIGMGLLRDRSIERVRQELWGLAIGYNLVRLEREHIAKCAGVSPRPISYRHILMLIRNFSITTWVASPGVLPQRLEALHHELALLSIPPRRSRRFPRTVKIKMSNYSLNRSRRKGRRVIYTALYLDSGWQGRPKVVHKAEKPFILAEREGFEPSVPGKEYARLAIWCLRPLGHLSARRQATI